MLQRVKEVQESDLRMVGALARNIQRVLPVTQADIDAAAAQGKGWLVKRVVKVNDPLDNMRGGTQLVIKQNSIQPGQNVMRVLYSGNSKTVGPAVAPLSLPGAAADDILSLIAFGGTEQRNLPMGYTQVSYIYFLANSYLTTDINPSYDGRYEFDFQTTTLGSSGATTYLGARPSSSGNSGLRVARISTQVFRVYGFGAHQDSTITAASNTRYKFVWDNQHAVMTSGGSTVLDLTYTGTDACAYPITINGWNSAGTVTPGSEGIFVYSFKAWNAQGELVADYVPTKDPDGVVGFYDMVSESFKTATAGTIAAGPDAAPIPTPDAPADIVCNNGALKYTPNLLDMSAENIVLGKHINNNGVISDSGPNFYNSKYIPVVAGGTYTWSTSSSISYFSVMEYDSDYAFKKRTLFSNAGTSDSITLRSDTAFVLIGSNMDSTDVTLDKIAAVDWQFEKGTSATSYKPYSPTKVYAAGPIETIAIKDDQDATVSIATCEDLLSVGTYTDEQEIISGVVTKKVGVMVLDGTEDWVPTSTTGLWMLRNVVATVLPSTCICTHFLGVSTTTSGVNMPDLSIRYGVTGFNARLYIRHNSLASVDDLKQFLADQYAAGTPVIVIHPLATPTTNTVTPQPMQTAAGDNTAEITQAGMAGLELEVEYVEA